MDTCKDVNRRIDGEMDGWIDGEMNKWIDGEIRWIDGVVDRRLDGFIFTVFEIHGTLCIPSNLGSFHPFFQIFCLYYALFFYSWLPMI